MKLSRIALCSLLSVIPLYANDHDDIVESIANDKMTVQPEETIIEETRIHIQNDSILDEQEQEEEEEEKVISKGMQHTIIENVESEHAAEVESTTSSPLREQAQHKEEMVHNKGDDENSRVGNNSQQTSVDTVNEDYESSDDTNMLKQESLETSESLEKQVVLEGDSNTDENITKENDNSSSSSSSSSSLKEENDTGINLQDAEETDGIKDDNSISLSDIPDNAVNDDEPSGNKTESVQTPEKIKQSENAEDCASNEEEEKNKPVEVDYANKSTGAQIVDKSKKFQGTSNLLVNDKDKYAMIECDAGEGAKYVIIGLSEEIRVKSIKLLSYERYSSLTKKFQVLGSQTYPVMTEWEDLGTFDAKPWYKENKEQTFEPAQPGWARYLKFRFLEHYGNEHYCSYTQIKVHGSTTLQGFHEMQLEQNEAAEAAKAVSDEIEHVSYVKSEKRDTDNNVADGKYHVEEEEEAVEEEELRYSNTDDIVETNEPHEKDDGGVAVRSHPDKVSSHESEEQSPNATGTTSVVDEKKSESVEVDKPETRASPKQDLNSGAHENQNVEATMEDSANDSQNKVSEERDITGHQQEPSNGDILESNEPQKTDVDKADKVVNTEDDVARSNHSKEMENVTLKASDMAKNAPNAHNSEEEVKGNPGPSSPPSVSNAVTSAINSVKNGSLMKDAVQGINKIIHSNAESKPNSDGSVHREAASPVETSSDDKSNDTKEINTEKVHSSESVVNTKEIHNPEHVAIHSSDLLDASVQSELPGQGMATKSNSNDITNKANVSSTREDILIAQEMVQMLSDRFPHAKCLDYLDFAEFKRRTLDVVNQKGSSIGEKPRVTVQKNEPIFKKLTDEIKGLQASQSVYEQYIKAATSCYQRVILDLGNEVVVKQNEQDNRMKALEDEMKKLKEKKLHHRLSAEDFRAIIYSLFESLASLTVKISPSLYSWCESLISFIAIIMERILTDERVKRMISVAVAYKRDSCIFALGVLCSYVFLNVSMKLNNPRKKNRKGQYKREKAAQHRSKNKEGIIVALHNAPSLHTDEEGSY